MTSPRRKAGPRKRKVVRDGHGRFQPGYSGNPKGRPRKMPEVPKTLSEHLADAMMIKMPVPGDDGEERALCGYEIAAQRLAQSFATAHPKEIMQALEWMEKLQVVFTMRERAEKAAEPPITAEDRKLLADVKQMMAEARAEREAQSQAASRKATSPSVPPRQPSRRPAAQNPIARKPPAKPAAKR